MVGNQGAGGTEFTVSYSPPTTTDGTSVVRVGCPTIKAVAQLQLSAADQTIGMRVFVDNVLSEVYWMNGRVAMTVPSTATTDQSDMTVSADKAGVSLISATAWKVKSIWVSPQSVLQTPRTDGGNTDLMTERIHAQQART